MYTCRKVTAFHGEVKRKRDMRWNVCRICWNTLRSSSAADYTYLAARAPPRRSFVFAGEHGLLVSRMINLRSNTPPPTSPLDTLGIREISAPLRAEHRSGEIFGVYIFFLQRAGSLGDIDLAEF